MKKLKVGQIGIAHNHGSGKMEAVRHFPDLFEVVGYAEKDEDWIQKRGNLPCYCDIPRLTEEEIIDKSDIVIIETNVWELVQTAQKCIDAGKHIHIDKPANGTLEEFAHLLNCAKEKNLFVQLGYMYRYNHSIKKCMEMIQNGELGEIYQIDAEMSTYHSAEYRQWLKRFNGGSMYIFGSHLIDLIVSILGEPENVIPFIKQTGHEGVYSDDNCFAVLEYKKAIARVTTLSVEVNGWGMRRFAVMGSKGTVEIKPIELDVCMNVSTIDKATSHYSDIKEKVNVEDVSQNVRYDDMVKDLYMYITGNKENQYTYEHELKVQRTLYRVTGEN